MREKIVVIAPYYNPHNNQLVSNNYAEFINGINRVGVSCITVECAYQDQPYQLVPSSSVIQVRTNSPLWQKDRLINLARHYLDKSYEYVAWVDPDILFDNDTWPDDLINKFKRFHLVQLFTEYSILDQYNLKSGLYIINSKNRSFDNKSFAYLNKATGLFYELGLPCFGWATRREIFDSVGLYEYLPNNSGAYLMAFAAWNLTPKEFRGTVYEKHSRETWVPAFFSAIQGRVGHLPGRVRHLWHGRYKNFSFIPKACELVSLGIDPFTDITAQEGQPLELAKTLSKPCLLDYLRKQLEYNKEDPVDSYI